ncbi:MAG: LacI family DNA-binding transcriptional regulator [Anaerolineaceae bacterium]
MKKRSTLADIARIADVSLMTASRAINGKPGLSEELRDKILEISREIGYRPNNIARGLATHQTRSIGLIVPDITNPFFAQIARGVEDFAFSNRYNLFLLNTNEDQTREESALDSLWQNDVEGLILCSSRLPETDLIQQSNRFPAVVLVNREILQPQPNLISINLNDRDAAATAVRYLIEQGRKQIGYIGGPANSLSNHRRLQGYMQALEVENQSSELELVDDNVPNTEGGWLAALTLLVKKPNLDAIFAFNDLMAVGAMQALQEVGKKIPADIAIIGVDDIPLATMVRPQLSTLHVDLQNLGQIAMQSLLDLISGSKESTSVNVNLDLFLRDST